ncbi:MAG: NAD+ synthase [Candidatus Cloacimonadales bacterium]
MKEKNMEKVIKDIVRFIQNYVEESGLNMLVVGLSGGIDSAVTAALCVEAVGAENVLAVMMPYKSSHPDSLRHAKEVAKKLQIKSEIINISPMVDSYFDTYAEDADDMRRGNRMARERMCVLYDLAAKHEALVAGTGNRSEILVGYCTQYGDNACAFEPIGHLYKTEIYQLAETMELPASVIKKAPTADLWQGQTDEAELGIAYQKLDEILHLVYDQELEAEDLAELGYTVDEIDKVVSLVEKTEFKRQLPPIPFL